MPVVRIDPQHPEPELIEQAAALLRAGQLVAFPTETVYGLGANALDPEAVARIYAAKGRPAWNPVIAHVPSIVAARELSRAWPASAEQLATHFWPGPLTLVVPKAAHVPEISTAGLDAVAVRMPDHAVALALLTAAGVPVAAPSANRFTQVSPTTAAHVVQSLGDRVPLVLDGGPCAVGIESTVVDCTGDDVVILRPGMLGRESLQAALEEIGVFVKFATRRAVAHDATPDMAPRSPGMADRHYAPKAEVWLFDGAQANEVQDALAKRARDGTPGVRMHALLRSVSLASHDNHVASVTEVRMPDDASQYARALYAALHDADAAGAGLVLIEAPPEGDSRWDGVRDRLSRAAR
ncbi:MAG: threonylcarbamoyl-AMP synthase [Gemmatimonas sp.]|nr:threonylcarbamoyl-AMP synthase [Gemmatimonas sp.]